MIVAIDLLRNKVLGLLPLISGGGSSANANTVTTGALTAHQAKTVSYGITTSTNIPILQVHSGNNIIGCSILRPKSGTETTECEIKVPYNVSAPGLTLTIVG